MEAIAPPYSTEFVNLFLPMVENEEITGTMRGDNENDLVSEFIGNFHLTIIFPPFFLYIRNMICFFYSLLQSTQSNREMTIEELKCKYGQINEEKKKIQIVK